MRSLLRAGVLTLVASLGSGVVGAPVVAQEVAPSTPRSSRASNDDFACCRCAMASC